jgi:hypothetical protein
VPVSLGGGRYDEVRLVLAQRRAGSHVRRTIHIGLVWFRDEADWYPCERIFASEPSHLRRQEPARSLVATVRQPSVEPFHLSRRFNAARRIE